MHARRIVGFGALALVVGCGGDGGGAVDAPFVPIDIDNGSCGDQLRFTGEYVDWDTHVSFCGINEAVIEVPGGAMDSTAPNGRFDLCIPDAPMTRLDVTQPSGDSQCTQPASGYAIPVVLIASKQTILSGALFSARAFTTERQATLFQAIGVAFDSTKAQVFVHVDGTPRAVSIAAGHAATQAVTVGTVTTDWLPGSNGGDVFFPNVDLGGGTTTLTVDGGAIGTGTIPLIAGTITSVSVFAN